MRENTVAEEAEVIVRLAREADVLAIVENNQHVQESHSCS